MNRYKSLNFIVFVFVFWFILNHGLFATDAKTAEEAAVAMSVIPETEQELSALTPFEAELRKCDVNIDDLLKEKINAKGSSLQDLKKRQEDQKNLILKLREG